MFRNFNPFVPIVDVDIASFDEAEPNKDLVRFTTELVPEQDLHGYSEPWAGGTMPQMIPDGTDTANGYIADSFIAADGGIGSSDRGYVSEYFPVIGGATYTWGQGAGVTSTTLNAICVAFYDETKTYISGSATAMSLIVSHTLTAPANAAYARSTQRYAANELLQFEAGSTATVAKPYSNVCPISGYTGLDAYLTGVNVWDEEWELGTFGGGAFVPSTSRIRNKNAVSVKPGEEYYVKTTSVTYVMVVNAASDWTRYQTFTVLASSVLTIPSWAKYIYFSPDAAYGAVYKDDISINYPDTDTEYHVAVGDVYPVSWSDVGTIYGGELNILTGELLKTYDNIASYNGETITEPWISSLDAYTEGGTPTTGAQVVYKLATPELIELDPTEIKTLPEEGTNNVWVNTGKIIELYYPIDISYFRRYFMVNSGYILLDGGDIDLTSTDPQLIVGSWDRIVTAMETGKPIWAYNTKYGTGKPLTPVPVFAWYLSATSIVIVGATLHITVSNTDYCVVQDVASA